jgi:hypothetical protein
MFELLKQWMGPAYKYKVYNGKLGFWKKCPCCKWSLGDDDKHQAPPTTEQQAILGLLDF